MQFPSGKTVLGRITNTEINSATAIDFTDIDGNPHVFAAGERLVIYSVTNNNRATAKEVTIFQDADEDSVYDAGEELLIFSHGGAGVAQVEFCRGLASKRINADASNTFFAVASAGGNVDLTIAAEVIKS